MLRKVIAGFAGLLMLVLTGFAFGTPASTANPARTTIIVSPHPDDEVLRAAGYINWAVGERGDHFVLLALSDGEATYMGKRDGLTTRQVANRRVSEQTAAFNRLTYGTGTIVRTRLPDGGLRAADVTAAINAQLANYPGAEVYCASHSGDETKDHREVAKGCRDSNAEIVRYLKDPRFNGGCTGRLYPVDYLAASDAFKSYWWTLGPTTTVASIRNAAINKDFASCYSRRY